MTYPDLLYAPSPEAPGERDADALLARLQAGVAELAEGGRTLAEEPAETCCSIFYDTFDWALYLDGGVLEHRLPSPPAGGDALLLWQGLDYPPNGGGEGAAGHADGEPRLAQPAPEPPGFPEDLPAGPVRARILGPCGIRRLLPRMQVVTRSRVLRVLDDEQKTVVRLKLDAQRFEDPETGRSGMLPLRVCLLPVRGYDADRDALAALLTEDPDLTPVTTLLLAQALAAAGRAPADYSSKLDYRLDPQARADAATRHILLGLLDTLERNIPGARANWDSEFLHDLRVAVRRTRSGLSQIRPVFPARDVEHWKARFAWLQQATGPVRDLDVYLLDFDDYRASLPAPMQPALDPLRAYILARYDAEQARLAETLGSPELADMLARWRAFLGSPLPERPRTPAADMPIRRLADRRIRRLAKRVRTEGRAIGPDARPEDLHELRKSCKKLRYLMEFFASLYPADPLRDLVKLMKTLLDNLGAYQDLSVQAEHLTDLARRMAAEGVADTDTLLAMGALIGDLYGRRQRARDAFQEVFAGFLAPETRERFQALLDSDPESGAPSERDAHASRGPGLAAEPMGSVPNAAGDDRAVPAGAQA